MSILNLVVDKRIQPEGAAIVPRPGKRTLGDPGTVPGGFGSGPGRKPGFNAAAAGRLLQDFIASSRSADQNLYGDNKRVRARANDLALNNPFIRKYLAMLAQNIPGPNGILMQAKVTNQYGQQTAQTKIINQRLELAWKTWCANCSADGRFNFVELEQMVIKNCGREGENFAKVAYDRSFNDCGIALQMLDNDQLDDSVMHRLARQRQRDPPWALRSTSTASPLAYHLFNGHPSDMHAGQPRAQAYRRAVHHRTPRNVGAPRPDPRLHAHGSSSDPC